MCGGDPRTGWQNADGRGRHQLGVALITDHSFEGPAKPASKLKGPGKAQMEQFSRGRFLIANPLRSDPYHRPFFRGASKACVASKLAN